MKINHGVFAAVGIPLLAAVLQLAAGCIGGPKPTYNQPEMPSGYWETAWVEPRIVMTDSVFTLIRADRVDSVYVEFDQQHPRIEPPAIEFAVPTESCFVAVNLALGSHRGIAYPLLARFLRNGNYKLSINEPVKLEEFPPREAIELRANVCGTLKVVPVVR